MCSDIIDISFVLVINAYLCSAISLTSILRCINCFKLSLSKSASTTFSILLRLTKGVFPSSGMCLLYSGSNTKSPILIALGSLSTYPLVWHKNNLDHILLAGLRDFWVWNWEKKSCLWNEVWNNHQNTTISNYIRYDLKMILIHVQWKKKCMSKLIYTTLPHY